MEMEIEELIERLKADQQRGAGELAAEAVAIMKTAILSGSHTDTGALSSALEAVARQLKAARPSMAGPINNAVDELMTGCKEIISRSGEILDAAQKCTAEADGLIEKLRNLPRMVARNFGLILPQGTKIMTHSYSSTCLQALTANAKKIGKIFVCESRPAREGRETARKLKEAGLNVTLITDAEAGYFMDKVDMAVVGADSILPNGDVINKMGTYLLALAARDRGKSFYVLSDTYKFLKSETSFDFEEKAAGEVWEAPSGIIVRNIYFDLTPARLITKIITEK